MGWVGRDAMRVRTSKDWAYQFLTFLMEGMSLRLCGSSSSSLTLCASLTGSSSAAEIGETVRCARLEVEEHEPDRN